MPSHVCRLMGKAYRIVGGFVYANKRFGGLQDIYTFTWDKVGISVGTPRLEVAQPPIRLCEISRVADIDVI